MTTQTLKPTAALRPATGKRHWRRSGFILIWGSRTQTYRDPSEVPFCMVCSQCWQMSNMVGMVGRRMFTLFFCPVFPVGPETHFTQCCNCGARFGRVSGAVATAQGGRMPPALPGVQSRGAAGVIPPLGKTFGFPTWAKVLVGMAGCLVLLFFARIAVIVWALLAASHSLQTQALAKAPAAQTPQAIPAKPIAHFRPLPATRPADGNLLAMVRPATDTRAGRWTLHQGTLQSSGNGREAIAVPFQLPEEYDLDLDLSRVSGDEDINVVMTAGGSEFVLKVGAWHNSIFGVDCIGDVTADRVPESVRGRNLVKTGTPHHLKVLVRKNDFEATLDNQYIYRITPDYSQWQVHPDWNVCGGVGFGLATQNSATAFSNLRITPGPG